MGMPLLARSWSLFSRRFASAFSHTTLDLCWRPSLTAAAPPNAAAMNGALAATAVAMHMGQTMWAGAREAQQRAGRNLKVGLSGFGRRRFVQQKAKNMRANVKALDGNAATVGKCMPRPGYTPWGTSDRRVMYEPTSASHSAPGELRAYRQFANCPDTRRFTPDSISAFGI